MQKQPSQDSLCGRSSSCNLTPVGASSLPVSKLDVSERDAYFYDETRSIGASMTSVFCEQLTLSPDVLQPRLRLFTTALPYLRDVSIAIEREKGIATDR